MVVFIVICFLKVPGLTFNNSFNRWIVDSSSAVIEYRHFLDQFGSDAFYVIVFEDNGQLPEDKVDDLLFDFSESLDSLEHIAGVSSWPLPLIRLKEEPAENTFSLIAFFEPPSALNPNRPELLHKIQTMVKDIPLRSHIAGTGVIYDAINQETRASLQKFLGLSIIFLIIFLIIIIRKPLVIIMTLGVSVGGILSLFVASSVLGIQFSLIHLILPVVILFYSTSTSLHILVHNGNFRKVIVPSLVANLTTMAGLIVFAFEDIPILNDFVLLALFGLLGSLFWAIVLFYPWTIKYTFSTRWLNPFSTMKTPSWKLTAMVFGGLLLLSLLKIGSISTNIDSVRLLSPRNKAIIDHHFIEASAGKYIPIEYVIPLDGLAKDNLEKWIDAVFELPQIHASLSFLDIEPFFDAKSLGYKSRSSNTGRITFVIPILSTQEGQELEKSIAELNDLYFDGKEPQATGYVPLYGLVAKEMGGSFRSSLLLAFIIVFAILLFYLRNTRLFLATIFPNLLPVLFILGVMGWFRIPIDMVTVPVGCLMLSIIVDDTIHFLYWYKKLGNFQKTYSAAGAGAFFTTLILVTGFSVFILAESQPLRNFGILCISALVAAILCDFLLLPHLLDLFARKNKLTQIQD